MRNQHIAAQLTSFRSADDRAEDPDVMGYRAEDMCCRSGDSLACQVLKRRRFNIIERLDNATQLHDHTPNQDVHLHPTFTRGPSCLSTLRPCAFIQWTSASTFSGTRH